MYLKRQPDETRDDFYSRMSRLHRNKLLAETDWVVTKAFESGNTVPEDYANYRQALRDITVHADFPFHEWPVEPK